MARRDSLEALSFLQQQSLPEAQEEVRAVRSATSDATNKILDAAEQIQHLAKTLENSACSRQILDAVTNIFEASVFHDITGQRLHKIAQALGALDSGLSELLNNKVQSLKPAGKKVSADDPASLLNGPALPGAAPSQAEIDKLFGSN
jgi:chemotaxis protein CheZ